MVLVQGLIIGRVWMNAIRNRGQPAEAVRSLSRASTSSWQQEHSGHGVSGERRSARRLPAVRNGSPTGRLNPYVTPQLLCRLGGTSIRNLSSSASARESQEAPPTQTELQELLKNDEWTPVYRYPYIFHCFILARLKLVHTLASCVLVPFFTFGYYEGWATLQDALQMNGVALFGLVALYVFSHFTRRLIGVVSVNRTRDFIRVGYLNFWGSRRNRFVPVDDVVPLSEIANDKGLTNIFVRFKQYSDERFFLYLPIHNVEIVDSRLAMLIFGENLQLFTIGKAKTKDKAKTE
uniref:Transmembrane protein 186 n=1 Tax=Plectus sambesii TaxID=2011161 RepID=A0A914VPI1_9BILA